MLKILDTEYCSLFRAWYAWPGPNAALCYNAGIRGGELRSSIQRLAVDIMGWTIWCKSHIFGFNFLVHVHHSDHCAHIPSRWHHNYSPHLVPGVSEQPSSWCKYFPYLHSHNSITVNLSRPQPSLLFSHAPSAIVLLWDITGRASRGYWTCFLLIFGSK